MANRSMVVPQLPGQNAPVVNANALDINVILNDYILLPPEAERSRVNITWTQDNTATNALLDDHPRSAEYVRCYGYNISSNAQHEVLVFMAAELVGKAFQNRIDLHLAKDETVADLKEPGALVKKLTRSNAEKEIKGPWIKVTEAWQYGLWSKKDGIIQRFLVYHPKTRKMYSKRFDAPAIRPESALSNAFEDVKKLGTAQTITDSAWGLISSLGYGLAAIGCQTVGQGIFVPIIDKQSGSTLENFTSGELAKP